MNENPIGIFDSGVGGLTVWKEVHSLLSKESCIYLADTKNAPYGEKSKADIISLSIKNTEFLLSKGCKLIIVACNTATTNAISALRTKFEVPFIGIEPAIKPAALQTATGKVGVLATKGTLSSSLFQKTSRDYGKEIQIIEREGKGLVSLIEEGKMNTKETKQLLLNYIKPMVEANIDSLVLGCTHYPFLIPILKDILPVNVDIIDCGRAVAKQTLTVLEQGRLLNSGKNLELTSQEFYSNGDKKILDSFLENFGIQTRSIQIDI